jgi:hypothetical protein
MNHVLIDNFFQDPDLIRKIGLSAEYDKSSKETGWKGYRCKIENPDVLNYVKSKLAEIDKDFEKMNTQIYFHYSLKETKQELRNFDKNRLHKDGIPWAGVIYLTPDPPVNSGTTLHNDNGELEYVFDNVYNRFILYRGDILHGPQDTFGDNINDSRLAITIFSGSGFKKENKTII